jgi:hypothetical protein
LGCFGDGRPDHGPLSQSCQASEYSYYNLDVQFDSADIGGDIDVWTMEKIARCTLQITNEAGDVLEDRELVDSSGLPVCNLGQTPYHPGVLDYSSCCRAGAQLTFGLVAENTDQSPLALAQGTAVATCVPGQVVSIDLVAQKI